MDVAVVATDRFGERADAGDFVTADVTKKLQALAGEGAGQSIPAFKGQVAFIKVLAAIGAMPGVDEAVGAYSSNQPPEVGFVSLNLPPHEANSIPYPRIDTYGNRDLGHAAACT